MTLKPPHPAASDRLVVTEPAETPPETSVAPAPPSHVGGVDPVPWAIEQHIPRDHYRVFKVQEHRSRHPQNHTLHSFYVIDSVDWVNIIPITHDGQVVLVRQWRHGLQAVTLEIPGGMVDEGESPRDAAVRELLEETGFQPESVELLGHISPNPAIQSNRCHTYLALNCRLAQAPGFDGNEQIEIVTVPRLELHRLAAAGEIQHALVIVALYWLKMWEDGTLSIG